MGAPEEPLIKRYAGNPILTKQQVPYTVETVHNAAVVRHQDSYVMVFRSHLRNGRSILGIAESQDGFNFQVRPKPFLVPAEDKFFGPYEEFGLEDPRICFLEGAYWITYSAYSRHGVRIGLARTENFQDVERVALITQADCRNVVLFPEKIQGLYVRLDRPHTEILPWSIWISRSPDMVYWGDSRVLISPMKYHWDEMKVGPGPTPIKTPQGWLLIYHGVFRTMDGAVYRAGAALLDLEDPSRVLGVADDWILQPEDPWEVTGYVHNVVFPCGAVLEPDNTLKLYWGGADTVVCAGTASMEKLVQICLKKNRPALGV